MRVPPIKSFTAHCVVSLVSLFYKLVCTPALPLTDLARTIHEIDGISLDP